MNSKLTLSTPVLKRLIKTWPGVDDGKIMLDLGRFGMASLTVDQLDIGQDIVELPLRIHPGGNVDSRGLKVTLNLSNWQVRDDTIWFTLESTAGLRGTLLKAAQATLLKLLDGIIQRYYGDQVHLLRNDDQLGIPINILLSKWEDFVLPVEIAGIEVNDGVAFYFR